ncbi:MAG: hypothetical protein GTN93_21485 [Anaerolineae bacterium]|nr:hypothetical protein [Anaerolineae bacterium]
MKIVCVCAGGNVRSVGTARILKYGFNQNAVAVAIEKNMPQPFEMLADWADVITVAEGHMTSAIPEKYHPKLRVVEVGPDVYGDPTNPKLEQMILRGMSACGLTKEIEDSRHAS